MKKYLFLFLLIGCKQAPDPELERYKKETLEALEVFQNGVDPWGKDLMFLDRTYGLHCHRILELIDKLENR